MLGYSERGAGSPVVLLHSGGLSSRQWGRLVEQLAPAHRVVAPDFLGYGRSSAWPRDELFHFQLDVQATSALLDALAAPAHVVGHSYGGFVALLATLSRPRLVRSLALFEPVAFGVLHSREDAAARASLTLDGVEAALLDAGQGGQESWLRAFVEYWQGPGAWDGLPEAARQAFRAVGWKLFGEVRSLLLDRTPHQAYASVAVPTLLLSAETSPLAARRVVAHLAEVIPGARAETIGAAGHMAPITHAEEVNRSIVDHIARSEATPPRS
ncbi:MAG TPA: alpha/beta fold hydrolase [Vicinamibacteria bacterium]|nr:alpha/beta fold hydrolase [Vicinamibacteria bacterium]